jgi:hypothetical protein
MTSGEKYTCGGLEDEGIANLVVSNTVWYSSHGLRENVNAGRRSSPQVIDNTAERQHLCGEADPYRKSRKSLSPDLLGHMPLRLFLRQQQMVSSLLICVVHLKTILETSAALFHPSSLLRLHALHNLSSQPSDHWPSTAPPVCRNSYESCEQEPGEGCQERLQSPRIDDLQSALATALSVPKSLKPGSRRSCRQSKIFTPAKLLIKSQDRTILEKAF